MRALHTQHAVALHLLEVARGISVSEEEYVFDRALLLAQQQRANAFLLLVEAHGFFYLNRITTEAS